ncbi:MAG: antibiotic biosynthesis monooxygenase [Pseudomonadota bacterium]|uniref:putative quinol monooxygenase n=1 Tax=Gallaecimonas pentaromativorans TaxID=584787 RepID=UPI00067EF34B|nr:antibiotic biosynthesis monooxygenase [Gallaecimonas pentaromativorans]MED5526496.1 antibiotic biosynthesis monooxygenase [Pseudomonadota bacterium]
MHEELAVVATIVAEQGFEAEVLAALKAVELTTQDEDGCLYYHLYRDSADSTRLVMLERWRDQAALDAHIAAAPFQALAKALEGKAQLQVSTLSREP